MKRSDPYAQMGLQWGDGATLAEIKEAYHIKSMELHPDRNRNDNAQVAARKFQDLQKAYQTLISVHSNLNGVSQEKDDEWRVSIWRNGDRIALNRTDVAGVYKKRPAPAAALPRVNGLLGHPDGRGASNSSRPAEYLDSGDEGDNKKRTRSSSVGRGLNKWVKPKEFQPWNGGSHASIRASDFKNSPEQDGRFCGNT